ncbi:hypothetical protein [Mesorhizobium dulcispinae]|uniref:hypothetical protein n=1 Tax=Mesorhizobium dulcispinae TaxID=3072316 RepID=UPI002A23F7AA|nr:hypothetical protein [Mesorhizobium sp. VK23D]MDX8521821.1 hypothetical protein [Mesorhizobium sp. VK23D]
MPQTHTYTGCSTFVVDHGERSRDRLMEKKSQREKFEEAARDLKTDQSDEAFEAAVNKIDRAPKLTNEEKRRDKGFDAPQAISQKVKFLRNLCAAPSRGLTGLPKKFPFSL